MDDFILNGQNKDCVFIFVRIIKKNYDKNLILNVFFSMNEKNENTLFYKRC